MGAGAKLLLQPGREGILGLLADHVTTDVAFAPALEAALSRYAGAVLVASREAAAAALALVREKKTGRVALVLARDGEAPAIPNHLPEGPGALGPLLRFVTLDARVARPIGEALRDVFVVESLEDAFRFVENSQL